MQRLHGRLFGVVKMSLLELEKIYFEYDEASPVFRDFSCAFEQGGCTVVKGDNGSGKTTLFRIMNGLSFPDSGRYIFDGTEITKKYLDDNKNARLFHKRVGYLFQNPDIMLFNARVYDEIAFGPRQMALSDGEVDKRVKDLMELFSLTELAGKAPYHLSGGQKKRVAFASVLALNPEVIFLDEPFAGLDKKNRDAVTEMLKALKSAGKTMIIATHDEELTGAVADEVITLG